MYVDNLPLSLLQIIAGNSAELVKINVVVLEPEFWGQRECDAAGRVKSAKLFSKLVVADLTLSNMFADT
jgi:hypothetical protein